MKPGLTGLWQVTARGEGEMHEHTDIDIEYVRRVAFRGDVQDHVPHDSRGFVTQGLLANKTRTVMS